MKKHLNLSILTVLVTISLVTSVGYAATTSVMTTEAASPRVYINSQERSLYQIALLSGISVSELRELNKGTFTQRDVVKKGESIVLPASSALFPKETALDKPAEKFANLPTLGSSNDAPANASDSQVAETHVANALQTIATTDWKELNSDKIKQRIENEAQARVEGYAREQVRAQIINPVEQAAKDFLGKFGTAKVNLVVSDEGSLKGSSLELFSPWYDSDTMLTFSQLSIRDYDDRTIGNFGVGQRWDVADKNWLLGYNVFFDHDFTRAHNRLGVGVEAWADYLKLAVNYYTPLSDWKQSKDFDDYLERAARGFDVRAQAYLPSYPHLGASLMYEQYFGDEVALFGKNNLQKDPRAITIGIDYTPVPLFTIKGQHKQGQDGNKEAQLDLTMNYRIGVPLNEQLDPDKVSLARTLKGSRYDMVDRNNNIILEYKQQKPVVNLTVPLPLALVRDGTLTTYEAVETEVFYLKIQATRAESILDLDPHNANDNFRERIGNAAGFSSIPPTRIAPPGQDVNQRNTYSRSLVQRTITIPEHRDITGWEIVAPEYDFNNPENNQYQIKVRVNDLQGNLIRSNIIDIKLTHGRRGVLNLSSSSVSNVPNSGKDKDNIVLNLYLARPDGSMDNVVAPFNDPSIVNDLGQGSGSITWQATDAASGAIVPLYDGRASDAACPAEQPACVLIKELTTDENATVAGVDNITQYSVKFVSTQAGTFNVLASFPSDTYAPSQPVAISFADNGQYNVNKLKIYRVDVDDELLGEINTNAGTFEGELMVGKTYRVEAYNTNDEPIPTDDLTLIQWALDGNQICGDSVTLNEFVVKTTAEGRGADSDRYLIPINDNSRAFLEKGAQCGDQGFKLHVRVE